jgi:hypothetical protein
VRPDTETLLMSGYTLDALQRYGNVTAETPLLHKPFTTHTLVRTVRDVLDAAPRPDRRRARSLS